MCAWPSASARTKNWGSDILTDADLEAQLDLSHAYANAQLDGTSGHAHTGATSQGPKLSIITALTVASQAQGDIIYASSSSAFARLGAGTDGQFLKTQGAAANPIWATVASFVDRGDPSAVDFAVGDLTVDGAFHDMDLSSIVPAGTIAVLLKVQVVANAANKAVQFRKNGNSNAIAVSEIDSQVISVTNTQDLVVVCDSSRIIEYLATSSGVTWSVLSVTVKGYWK